MQKKIFFNGSMLTSSMQLKAQYAKQESTYKKCFVDRSLFMLG